MLLRLLYVHRWTAAKRHGSCCLLGCSASAGSSLMSALSTQPRPRVSHPCAGSLADMFQRGEYPSLTRAVQLAIGCAKGMEYLHNRRPQQVIHRDLKPANLMIGELPAHFSIHRWKLSCGIATSACTVVVVFLA